MGSDFFFRDKISVAILGATGLLGQKLIQHLVRHPWFEIVALCDVDPLIGQFYGDVVNWHLSSPLPKSIAKIQILPCEPSFPSSLIFSALNPKAALAIEIRFAEAGYQVISHSFYPQNMHVPVIVAEINPSHLALMEKQPFSKGHIVATPQPVVSGLTLALKPLMDQFGLEAVQVVTLQPSSQVDDQKSSSGLIDSLISFIEQDPTKIEQETLKILGQLQGKDVEETHFKISAQCAQMENIKADLLFVSVQLRDQVKPEQLVQAWSQFASGLQRLQLPTAPFHPLSYGNLSHHDPSQDKEMSVKIANLHPCSVLDYKFSLTSSHLMRGIVGSALLNAELLVTHGKIYW